MRTFSFPILVCLGIVLLAYAFLYDRVIVEHSLTGTAAIPIVSEQDEITYEAKIKNPLATSIRLCGGQMNWCGQSGCYRVITPFPITIEPRQEATITISLSPSGEKISETELILYADSKGLNGLTPIRIKLPATSHSVP